MAETLVSPAGTTMVVQDPAEVARLRGSGWEPATAEQTQAFERSQEYGGPLDVAGAAGAGALRGATMGLSDVALAQLGAGERLRAYRELHPGVSLTGEVAGSLLGAGKLGGGGVLRTGLRTLSAPSRGAMRLAEQTARLGGGPVTRGAVRGATEGALFGVQQAISEDALGERELTGQSLLGHVGFGAMTGGAFGAAISGSGRLVRGGMERLGSALRRPTAEGVEMVARGAFGETVEGVGEVVADRVGRMSKAIGVSGPTDELSTIWRQRDKAFRAGEIIEKSREEIKRSMKTAMTEVLEKGEEMKGLAKYQAVRQHANPATAALALDEARAVARQMRADLQQMAGSKDFSNTKQLKELVRRAERAEGKLGRSKDVAKGFMLLDDLKREIDKVGLRKFSGKVDESLTQTQRATKSALVDRREALRGLLEREDLFGGAAKLQLGVNDKWSAMFRHLDENPSLRKLFKKAPGKDPFSVKRVFDEEALDRVLANPSSDEGKAVLDALMQHVDLGDGFVREVGKYSKGASANYQRALGEGADALGRMREAATLQRQVADLSAGALQGGAIATGITGAGAYALGPLAAPLGLAAKVISDPMWAMRSVYGVESAAKKLAGRMQGVSARAVAIGSTRALTTAAVPYHAMNERQRRKALSAGEAAQAASPEMVAQDVTTRLGALGVHSPAAVDATIATAMHATEYLARHAPSGVLRTTALEHVTFEPPDDVVQEWDARRLAVDRPMSVVDTLSDGDMPHPAAVEALQEVYPDVYREHVIAPMVVEVQEQLARGRMLTPETKAMVQMITGAAVSPLDAPEIADFIANAYAQAKPEKPAQPPPAGGEPSRRSQMHRSEAQRAVMEE